MCGFIKREDWVRAPTGIYFRQLADQLRGLLLIGLAVCVGCQSDGLRVGRSRMSRAGASENSSDTSHPRHTIKQVAFDATSAQTNQSERSDSDAIAGDENMIVADQISSDQISSDADQANTLRALEAVALQNHPSIIEARTQVDAAQGQYVQAGLPFNPVLQYQSDEIGNEDATGLHSLRVSQQFVTANKLGIAQQVAAQTSRRRRAELQRAELEVLTRVRIAFARTLISQQRVELTDQIVQLADQSVQSVEQLFRAQEVSKVTLLQSRLEAQQARIDAENSATALAANRRSLAAAAGVSELSALPLIGDPTAGLSDAPWQPLIDRITELSPELAARGADFERAQWALRLACAQVTPNVTTQLGGGVVTASDDLFGVISVSVPLPIRNRNQGNIRSARADVASTMAASERVRLDLVSRLADAVGRYRIARQRHQRLTNKVLPFAEQSFELSRIALEAEELSFLQFLTAQRTLITTKLRILDALLQAKEAWAEIDGLLVATR